MIASREFLITLFLAVLTLGVYLPVRQYDFVNFDDDLYVTDNPHVKKGLTGSGLRWAWTTLHAGYWQPLTWMSLQLDAHLHGEKAGGFHLTNLFLHIANVVLLFHVLRRMTGTVWRPALLAALFAVHPLHVESVAWVTERKDVLSTFFWMLTLIAYLAYLHQPVMKRYCLIVAAFVMGLMAKPMLVTLPCVLLLLDYWPFDRLKRGALLEKLPLFGISALFSVVTVVGQKRAGAMNMLDALPLKDRLANVPVAYVRYLAKTVWPMDLGVFYPHPATTLSLGQVVGALGLLLGLTVLFFGLRRRAPYLVVGWLWFLGTMFPVSGVMQAGEQALADRFAYVPNIGLYLMLAWGLHDLLARVPRAAILGATLAGAMLLGCLVLTSRQVEHWRNSETLWKHTLEVTGDNAVAQNNLGEHFGVHGKMGEALHHFERAVRIRPHYADAQFNLAQALFLTDRFSESLPHYRNALEINPQINNARLIHSQLRLLYWANEQFDEAQGHAARVVELPPDPEASDYNLLGVILSRQGQWQKAADALRRALELQPNNGLIRCNLAFAQFHLEETAPGRARQEAILEQHRDRLEQQNVMVWKMAVSSDPQQRSVTGAFLLAFQFCQLSGFRKAEFLDTLAAAQAGMGLFDRAVATARLAEKQAKEAGNTDLVNQIQMRQWLYENRQSYLENRLLKP